ncbi:hypothetical protein ACWERY_33815 [Streptomyces sp. NPDC004082]|uniref:hypothetical protein n=1 Tax=Streptomyces sp. NPDC005481 TaxID=3154881 RepID=UPI0033BE01D8
MPEDVGDEDGAAAAVRLSHGVPLGDALAVADPGAWLALDAGVRALPRHRLRHLSWWNRSASQLSGRPGLDESRLALALCHWDGRVRQEAVHQAAGYPGLLPLVVIRCADWAAPVREAARRLLREALDLDAALALAPLVLRVGRRDRGAFGVDVLGEALRRAPLDRLEPLFADHDRAVRRFAYGPAVEGRLIGPAELARVAAEDEDTVVQDLCASAALTAVGDEDVYEEVLLPLLSARNPRTRSAGVTALRRAGRPAEAEAFLADRSALVRACARYVVRQHGGDPAAWYRKRCAAPEGLGPPPGAVSGLAECGEGADAGLLWPLLAHPADGVRARAVAGLRALDRVDTHRLRPLLDDPAPGVVRETAVALLPYVAEIPADLLLERTGSAWPRHVRIGALRLLDALGGLAALRAAVGLLEDPDETVRTRAGRSVQGWRPSAHLRFRDPEVGELLQRSRHLMSEAALRRRKWEAGVGS